MTLVTDYLKVIFIGRKFPTHILTTSLTSVRLGKVPRGMNNLIFLSATELKLRPDWSTITLCPLGLATTITFRDSNSLTSRPTILL